MLSAFQAQNYGCLKNVELSLAPLQALIGPNDSGKSTILDGIRTCLEFTGPTSGHVGPFFRPGTSLRVFASGGGRYGIRLEPNGLYFDELDVGIQVLTRPRNRTSGSVFYGDQATKTAIQKFGVALHVRFDPSAMRTPTPLVAESSFAEFIQHQGKGLPGVLATLQLRGDDAFDSIRREMLGAFPTLKTIGTRPVGNGVALRAELQDGSEIDASQLSEGVYYFLAYQLLRRIVGPRAVLLVEEPENGLHPSRIAEVMKILRDVSKSGTQVVLATHSPLVVNELAANEVAVVTRPSAESGTVVTPIDKTPNFEKRASVYSLGELWLSYADGKTEEPLLRGAQ